MRKLSSFLLVIIFLINLNFSPSLAATLENGQTQTVSITATVPEGWVIKQYNDNDTMEIKNLSDGKYGDIETVVAQSPVPNGWVIKSASSDIKYELMCINGAKYGEYSDISVSKKSIIPKGWVIIKKNYRSSAVNCYRTEKPWDKSKVYSGFGYEDWRVFAAALFYYWCEVLPELS